jgi:signal transduction histidine kinase
LPLPHESGESRVALGRKYSVRAMRRHAASRTLDSAVGRIPNSGIWLGEDRDEEVTAHRRIIVGLSAAVLGIVALGVSAIVRLTGIEAGARLIATDSMPGLNYTTQIELYTHLKSALIQRHILTNDPAEKRELEAQIQNITVNSDKQLELYRNTPFGDIERPLFNRVIATRPPYVEAVETVLRLSRETTSAAVQVELQKVFEPESRLFLEALHKSTEHNLGEANQAAQRIQESVGTAKRSAMIEAMGSLLLALVAAFLLARVVSQTESAAQAIEVLNRELEGRVGELTEVNHELEAFTYSVSHDLRAPLRHIDGFSKILLDDSADHLSPTGKRAVDRIRYGAQQMGRMIDDLLEFSRLGRRDVARRPTNLRALVDESLEILKPAMEERAIDLRIGELPMLDCDPALLRHVMVNLLSNAIKFTRDNTPAVIEIGQITGKEAPVVYVRDNGVGFDMRYVDKLFGIFQRLHRREDFEGVGVGLATVQRVIHKHGGRVWAESEIGKGTTFYFALRQPEKAAGILE